MNTIIHLVNHSKNGKTNSELAQQQCVYVQNALLSLFKAGKIQREELNDVYVYVSSDQETARDQIKTRIKIRNKKRLANWIVAEVLIASIAPYSPF